MTKKKFFVRTLTAMLFAGAVSVATATQPLPDIYLRYTSTVNNKILKEYCGIVPTPTPDTVTVEEFFSGVKHAKFTRGTQYTLDGCNIVIEGPFVTSEIDDGEFRYTWRNNNPVVRYVSPVKTRAIARARLRQHSKENPAIAKAVTEMVDWQALTQGISQHINKENTGQTVLGEPCITVTVANTKTCQWATIPAYGPLKRQIILSRELDGGSMHATDFVVGKALPKDIFKVPEGLVIKEASPRR